MSNNAHDLSKRLLNALDSDYNVVDMHTVNEIISVLEKINITKELLETTRLGKHVNELRRKTSDPALARRAKVLVKRWRDLVIPGATASPAHTVLPPSNRSSAERTARRLGGTPLTSPALMRHVVSPAVPSPRPPSRPTWGGYESDSQDVIVLDDDPPPAPPPAPTTPSKKPPSPIPIVDDKKAKRDKKPKKKRGHSRAGSSGLCNGSGSGAGSPLRRNGCHLDSLVHRMPPIGAKKVKTTKELLEDIQNRGSGRPESPGEAGSPDVQVIEPDDILPTVPAIEPKAEPPNGVCSPVPMEPLEDWREEVVCTCGSGDEEGDPGCGGGALPPPTPLHVAALHHLHLPGVNGTRAPRPVPPYPLRPLHNPTDPELFHSVVPLYKYQDYADDWCVKNMYNVPLCTHLPHDQPPPTPPALSPPPSPPPLRPYPPMEPEEGEPSPPAVASPSIMEISDIEGELVALAGDSLQPEMVSRPPVDRLLGPLLTELEERTEPPAPPPAPPQPPDVVSQFERDPPVHRTVPKTKPPAELTGRTLYELCDRVRTSIPYEYGQTRPAPVVSLPLEAGAAVAAIRAALAPPAGSPAPLDEMRRPQRPPNFAEWYECAQLGDLVALPYVVID